MNYKFALKLQLYPTSIFAKCGHGCVGVSSPALSGVSFSTSCNTTTKDFKMISHHKTSKEKVGLRTKVHPSEKCKKSQVFSSVWNPEGGSRD